MAILVCALCGADLGPDVTDHCPKCGKYPWLVPQSRLQDKAFRQSLPRAVAAPVASEAAPIADRLAPVLPGNVQQFYLPAQRPQPKDAQLEYRPLVLGFANVVFILDKHKGTEHSEAVRLLAPAAASGHPTAWQTAEAYSGPAPEATAADPNALLGRRSGIA